MKKTVTVMFLINEQNILILIYEVNCDLLKMHCP